MPDTFAWLGSNWQQHLPSRGSLQVGLSIQGCREGHVVQSALQTTVTVWQAGRSGPAAGPCAHLDGVDARVSLHALDTVLGLVGRQLPAQLLGQDVRLVRRQDAEGVDDLLGGVDVGRLASHEVEEAVELNVSTGIGVNNGENALEVNFALLVLANTVAQRDQAVLELLWVETAGP